MIKGWKNAHSDLAAARRRSGAEAKPFVVRAFNKDGSLSKMAPSEWDCLATREEAHKRAEECARLNPGRKYAAIEKATGEQVHVAMCEK